MQKALVQIYCSSKYLRSYKRSGIYKFKIKCNIITNDSKTLFRTVLHLFQCMAIWMCSGNLLPMYDIASHTAYCHDKGWKWTCSNTVCRGPRPKIFTPTPKTKKCQMPHALACKFNSLNFNGHFSCWFNAECPNEEVPLLSPCPPACCSCYAI